MATPRSREALRFYRAAFQRLREADFLLVQGGYTTAAVYLAGYAVECILKALVLSREPVSRHPATLETFRGTRAHSFDWLWGRLAERGVSFPRATAGDLVRVNLWATDLRYDPVSIRPRKAIDFLRAARAIVRWADQRM